MGAAEFVQVTRNSIAATFLDDAGKKKLSDELDAFLAKHPVPAVAA